MKYKVTKKDFEPSKKMMIKSLKIPKELMDLYAEVLKELERGFSEDVRLMIRMRIVSSQNVKLEVKRKLLEEIKEEMKNE